MNTLEILHFPDPRLRTIAKEVTQFNPDLGEFVNNMLQTMYAAPGIGLAATQVNRHERIIVIDISEEKNEPVCLINPVILEKTGDEESEEGCLSVPGQYGKVQRADTVTVRYQDIHGKFHDLTTGELLAVCIQHEIDHLDGKLFVDYLTKLKRNRIRKKLEKTKSQTLESDLSPPAYSK